MGRATATFEHAINEYEHHRMHQRKLSMRTWAGEKPGLVAFADFMRGRGRTYLSQVTEDDADMWWGHVGVTYAEATQYTRMHQLRSFLKYGIQRGWLTQDPTRFLGAKQPRPKQRERLDADELLRLLTVTRWPRDRVLYAIAMNLALRGGEIQRLRVKDVDLDGRRIFVQVDKTGEDDWMTIGPDLELELRRWLLHYRSTCPAVCPDSALVPAMWTSTVTDRVDYKPHRSVGEPYDVVQRGLQALGWEVTKGEGEHTLRRSVATIFFDTAVADGSWDEALLATMSLLHHDRPETTLRYIGRNRVDMARDRIMARPFLSRLATGPLPAPIALHSVK